MTAIDDPRVPGFRTGVASLTIAVLPAVWIGTFLVLGDVPGTTGFRDAMLLAEPFTLPILAALAVIIALFALWRDTRRGRTLAVIAIVAVAIQTAAVACFVI